MLSRRKDDDILRWSGVLLLIAVATAGVSFFVCVASHVIFPNA